MSAKLRECIFCIAFVSLTVALLWSCATVPYTGREQLLLISPQQELALGERAATQILREENISSAPRYVDPVKRVGNRIAAAANTPEYNWQFHVVEDNEINAFALPGGEVFVNTGMFRVADSDAGLATVISHEIAHVIARHGAERMSRQMLAQLGGTVAAGALNIESPGALQAFDLAYGLATNVGVILPHSRSQELEADRIGLILMAKAGYDPRVAMDFWQRMMDASRGPSTPAFLSTHPASEDRLQRIREILPEALRYYGR